MKTIEVEYQVKPGFAEQNKANINAVMAAVKEAGLFGVHYSVFVKDDGVSFLHINSVDSDAAMEAFTALPAFKAFQTALRESEPVFPPNATNLQMVGSTH